MRITALEIPEREADLAGWLEEKIVGLELGVLVAELAAVHGPECMAPPRRGELARVLGGRLETVLEQGLAAVEPGALGGLLKRPPLLRKLQKLVLLKGEGYWEEKLRSSRAVGELVRRTPGPLKLRAEPAARRSGIVAAPAIRQRDRRWVWFSAGAVLAAAASLSIALLIPRPRPSWGWSRSDALAEAPTPGAYLNRLAQEAEEWFRESPNTPTDLALRIHELRSGCTRLILAEHQALPAPEKTWLVGKCREWAGKIDAQLSALESGAPPPDVRLAVDEIVHKLAAALRAKATENA